MPTGGFFVYADMLAHSARDSERVLPRRARAARRRDHAGHRLRPPSRATSTCASRTRSARRSSRTASRGSRAICRAAADSRASHADVAAACRDHRRRCASSSRALRRSPAAAVELLLAGRGGPARHPARARSRSPRCIAESPTIRAEGSGSRACRRSARSRARELALPDNAATRATPTSAGRSSSGTCSRRRSSRSSRGSGASRSPAASATAATSTRPTRAPRRRGSRRRATTCTSAACPRIRRSAISTTRCCRRSSAGREVEVARLVFHELAHQVVYVKDDTPFNESFAVAVEEAGRRALARARRRGTPGARSPPIRAQRAVARRVPRADRATRARELTALYASDAPRRRASARRKAAVFAAMRADYERAKAGEPGLAGYDRWFAGHDGRGRTTRASRPSRCTPTRCRQFRGAARGGGRRPRRGSTRG